jgi:hypothetical protein
MAKKADAWKEYKEAAIVDMMLQVKEKVFCTISFIKRFFAKLRNTLLFSC